MTTITCPACRATTSASATFCPSCGALLLGLSPGTTSQPGRATVPDLVTVPVPVDTTDDPAQGSRDHLEASPASWVAGVCDRGMVHERNEDAQALAASEQPGRFAALVVCDGVSSSPRPELASQTASRATLAVLSQAAGSSATQDWASVLTAAARAGNDAIARAVGPIQPGEHSFPSCTLVAAVVDSGRIVATSVGDSRAYWLPDTGRAQLLTTDDSWAQDMIAAGMPREQAEKAPRAHAITRWLGPDAPPVRPTSTVVEPEGPGWLCVCSDGLWNYCSQADDLSRLVSSMARAAGGDPLVTAQALVSWVNAKGGRDNVTVTLARLGSARQA
ncbi:MAG: protein phosphatase 2C domain-containing protein [Micrococcales bacterium]|nr:protein phosphatase 2C domain-containing protein [Micrococcales bacterium]